MAEFVISDKQLATVILKYGGRMMEYDDGTYFVNYDEIDKYEMVEIHELIRCMDCKHYHGECCYAEQWSTAILMPFHKVMPDGFCKWGEKE